MMHWVSSNKCLKRSMMIEVDFVRQLIKKFKSQIKNIRGWNVKIDRECYPISDETLKKELPEQKLKKFDLSEEEFWNWLKVSGLEEFIGYSYLHKKALEFFFSSHLLDIRDKDIVLDIAGGKSNYLLAVKRTFSPSKLILQDHIYEGIKESNDILIVGGDVSNILLPDMSVHKIACHHAFEHFKGNTDSECIKEISRLLKPGGKAVIIPIFISKDYIECYNIKVKKKFDNNAKLIVDKTASLPGGSDDGHFARIYNIRALYHRVLVVAEKFALNWSIATCTLDHKLLPDMNKNFGAKINYPLRALVLIKK